MEVLNFTVLDDTFKGSYLAISKIKDTHFIFLPNTVRGVVFVFDYMTHVRMNLEFHDENKFLSDDLRITDASDVGSDGSFWLLGTLKQLLAENQMLTFLIKCKYDPQNLRIITESRHLINDVDDKLDDELNFQGMCLIPETQGSVDFLLCSANNKYGDDPINYQPDPKKYGMIYVSICDDNVRIQGLKLDSMIDRMIYDVFNFSSIFKHP